MIARKRSFSLIYDPQVREHLRAIDAKYHSLIRRTVEEQLVFEPDTETRNRKPLQRGTLTEATWELRFGPEIRFRVLFEVDYDGCQVHVLAVGVKQGSHLLIGGEEVEL